MKVIITGFDPFGGEAMNPAYEAVKLLPDEVNGHRIIKKEIPTVFRKSLQVLEETIKEEQPDIVICVGQAGGRFGITPERVAINQDDGRIPDNEGNQPIDETIHKDGEMAYFSKLPIKKIVSNLQKENIPASVSNTAGTYVCNHVMYGLLYMIDKWYPTIRGGFIHVPYATSQVIDKPNMPSLTLEQIRNGLLVAITTTLETTVDEKISGGAIS